MLAAGGYHGLGLGFWTEEVRAVWELKRCLKSKIKRYNLLKGGLRKEGYSEKNGGCE